MKKFFNLILAISLFISLTGCCDCCTKCTSCAKKPDDSSKSQEEPQAEEHAEKTE